MTDSNKPSHGLRTIKQKVLARATSDGAGVNLLRSLGMFPVSYADPFLLLDEFSSSDPDDYIAGFPPHPHRGFETVTYMIDGHMRHEDSAGHTGDLRSGGVQWMTAGRGIVHSEMPMQENGLMRGFQLWVNLPASEKMREPRYQNIEPEEVPRMELGEGSKGSHIKIIAGRYKELAGPVQGVVTNPLYFDITLAPDCEHSFPVSPGYQSLAYPFEGSFLFGSEPAEKSELVIFSDGDRVVAKGGPQGGRFLLLAARPIGEEIARGGPFVMNTREEIKQAYDDFSNGNFG